MEEHDNEIPIVDIPQGWVNNQQPNNNVEGDPQGWVNNQQPNNNDAVQAEVLGVEDANNNEEGNLLHLVEAGNETLSSITRTTQNNDGAGSRNGSLYLALLILLIVVVVAILAYVLNLSEDVIFQGYDGERAQFNYTIGKHQFSKEPLAFVTRKDDIFWSDFVNWVLQALLNAEKQNITKNTAFKIDHVYEFGEQLVDSFRNAVAAVGNYGEIYNRNLEQYVPRQSLNNINNGDSGLMYSIPFGKSDAHGPSPKPGSTLHNIRSNEKLKCGVVVDSSWKEFYKDFCRAIAAGIFSKDNIDNINENRTDYVELSNENIFEKLKNKEVDVLSGITITLARDVKKERTGIGFTFTSPIFYENDTLVGSNDTISRFDPKALVTRQDDSQWSSFVYWIAMSLIYAEENNLNQDSASGMPLVSWFGGGNDNIFQSVISVVGSYRDIYERNIDTSLLPRSGLNKLNNGNPPGPQHFVIPRKLKKP